MRRAAMILLLALAACGRGDDAGPEEGGAVEETVPASPAGGVAPAPAVDTAAPSAAGTPPAPAPGQLATSSAPRKPRPAGCASEATDSARAVCAAVEAVQRKGAPASWPLTVTREGRTWCVVTSPRDPRVTDRMGVARVGADGAVQGAVVSDRPTCADVPAR